MASLFSTLVLITGGVEFLADRAMRRALAQVHDEDPETSVSEVDGSSLAPGELAGLTSPSLFSAHSAVVVRGIESLDPSVADELLAYAAAPAPDVAVVLTHGGGQKGKGVLDKLRKLGAVQEIVTAAPKPWEVTRWTSTEVRQLGASISEDAADYLVAAVGHDLRSLAAAADQLVDAATGADGRRDKISLDLVRQYFGGRAEVKGFDIADAAIDGDAALALEQLRWAINNNVAPVLITSAFATGLRSLARYGVASSKGLREAELAREVGAPPFRLKRLRAQLKGWDTVGITTAIAAVARADLDVKGAADPEYALERMVLGVVAARVR
ncbi:DNA polymerase III subunit delta [Mumia sp. ZJ1417]|uniref:DNA polymerase III subunit delta n=1 Tax=unclassified Mumia TaxID=2621872 RepID=UPI0014213D4E|nr:MULTISPECIES: DNA polymerase III subunit delta [unclassified Mumia]QMW67580.1 DNA polymerase III subunit delta [Mumia sp. ZJ1417]